MLRKLRDIGRAAIRLFSRPSRHRIYERGTPCYRFRQCLPYGRQVRIVHRHVREDPLIGTVGRVLSEKEHGIIQLPGLTLMTPKYPGIRNVHYLVQLKGEQKPRMLQYSMFAPL